LPGITFIVFCGLIRVESGREITVKSKVDCCGVAKEEASCGFLPCVKEEGTPHYGVVIAIL
jgi:hypothetical protein